MAGQDLGKNSSLPRGFVACSSTDASPWGVAVSGDLTIAMVKGLPWPAFHPQTPHALACLTSLRALPV